MKSITFLMHNIYAMGGTVKAVTQLANTLAQKGHKIEIISVFRAAQKPYFDLDQRIKVTVLVNYQLRPQNAKALLFNRLHKYLGLSQPKLISNHEPGLNQFNHYVEKKIIKAIKHVQTDVLISTRASYNILTATYAPAHLETVGMEHMNLEAYPSAYKEEIIQAYKHLSKITVLTYSDKQTYMKQLTTPVYVIPNMITEPRLKQRKQNVIVSAGRLEYEKGFDLLIKSINKVQSIIRTCNYQVKIFGDGQEKEHLNKMIAQFQLTDIVQINPPTPSLNKELAQSKITVVPSRNEGFGMVILEAMNQESAVVSFKGTSGPESIITHEHDGYLLPYENTDALAHQIKSMTEDETLIDQVVDNGNQTLESYSPSHIYEQFKEMLE
ncbi:glycosyltransferase family 4 protein [Staphylococcus sp. SQ8-PEA]|uniref:Glycosyltransferase family 4 protein n=1 Tax=Staphylococcus marylandisciuri TaxID=2981529 RepID=A0ABT2QMP8_9STAP|nr:glycosyltransferase family 4 protein [Staphylococcus marylandisciuri]MCU5745261.1 glycosyltransferase family 4 protein [Staphylococcus marylandisciuri]